MSDNLSVGERIYCLEQDIKDYVHRNNLEQDKELDWIIQQAEKLHELYNQIRPSENVDILELRRFYEDLYKTHNLYDLAQKVGVSESSLRCLIYGYHIGNKVLQKCYDYAKKFIGE